MMDKEGELVVGTWFCVPLRTKGYAIGVVTRIGDGGVLFGYFFSMLVEEVPLAIPDGCSSEDKILCTKFGCLGFKKKRWPIIGVDECFDPNNWPLPPMIRVDDGSNVAFLTEYNDVVSAVSEKRVDASLIDRYPYDSLLGAGAVEIKLTNLIARKLES